MTDQPTPPAPDDEGDDGPSVTLRLMLFGEDTAEVLIRPNVVFGLTAIPKILIELSEETNTASELVFDITASQFENPTELLLILDCVVAAIREGDGTEIPSDASALDGQG